MRKPTKLVSALALGGVVLAGGSVFTAASTIDQPTKSVGAAVQTISGVNVQNVSYVWDYTTDETSAVKFSIAAPLQGTSTMKATLNGVDAPCALDAGAENFTAYTCTLATPIVDVTDLDIIVN